MLSLFSGFSQAYGTYGSEDRNDTKNGKLEIRATARTIREAVTPELWDAHLRGKHPLGIIPITSDNTCYWGVIDVDKYDLIHDEIIKSIERDRLPLIVCRSKSGGAHLFLFVSSPVSATIMVSCLREMAVKLGLGDCEIFPKQIKVLTERGDLGNWLNMPYFGGDNTTRYGIKKGGLQMTTREFLTAAEGMRISPDMLSKVIRLHSPPPDEMLVDAPPCIQHLTVSGFPEGSRNNGLFSLGVFCKKKFGDDWERALEDCNRIYMKPPLDTVEVLDVIKRLKKKEYNYRCGDQPISPHCNSALCRTRRYGVGGQDDFPVVSGMSVLETEPPLWFLDIEGERIEMITDDLLTYRRFHKICAERLVKCYQPLKQNTWMGIVGEAMKGAIRIAAPPEVGLSGQFTELLEDFCMNRHRGKAKEDILGGRPWEDEETGRHYFRLRDLMQYLEREGFKGFTRSQITVRLKRAGGGSDFFNVKGKGFNVWYVPTNFQPIAQMDTPKRMEDPL
jgi:hypothetical protein